MRVGVWAINIIMLFLAISLTACGSQDVKEFAKGPSGAFDGDYQLRSNEGNYIIEYSVVGHDHVPLNELFDLKVVVRDVRTKSNLVKGLQVDAAMPEHMHGMNVVPNVIPEKTGIFRVQGMLFHMPGRWELYFDITKDGVTERAQTEINLE